MPPAIRWMGVCLDCADAQELAGFYGALLGWEITATDGAGWINMRDPNGGVGLNFQAEPKYVAPVWPEAPGAQQKMLHFEILVDDVNEAVEYARSLGATEPEQPADRDPAQLRVLLDPAGHPFCLCTD